MLIDENDKLEYKERVSNSLPKEIVSFLNSEGGTILIGINNKKDLAGVINIDEAMRQISDIMTDQISPRWISFVKQFHEIIDGKDIIKIEIKKGDQLFYIKKYGLSEMGFLTDIYLL